MAFNLPIEVDVSNKAKVLAINEALKMFSHSSTGRTWKAIPPISWSGYTLCCGSSKISIHFE